MHKAMNGEVDAAGAIENMILSTLGDGVGSCWLGTIDREHLRTILELPLKDKIDFVSALGYPAESPVVKEAKDSTKY